MKLAKPWILPATGSSSLHSAIALPAVLVLLGIAWQLQRHTLHAVPFSGLIMAAYALLFAGVFWLATYLRIACDALQLRMPGVSRHAVLRVIGWTAVLILLPGWVFGFDNGHIAGSVLLCALSVVAGLSMGVLPQGLAIVIPLSAALLVGQTFAQQRSLDVLDRPVLQLGLLLLTAILAGLVSWRWRVASRHPTPYAMPAMPAVFKRTGACRGRAPSPLYLLASGLRGEVQLQPSGPQYPSRSMRIALGGVLMPLTAASRLRLLGTALAVVIVLMLAALSRYSPQQLWQSYLAQSPTNWVWLLAYVAFSFTMAPVNTLKKNWHAKQTPTTLALLPGLGDLAAQRRQLLLACLLQPLLWQGLIALIMAIVCTLHPVSALALSMLGAGQLLVLLLGLGGTLDRLSGKPLSKWSWVAVIVISMSLWGFNNMLLPTLSMLPPTTVPWLHLLLAAWVLWLLALAVFAVQRWRRYQQRPNPWLID